MKPHTEYPLILGIESSCDETAAAVLKDGKILLSNVVSTQIEIHREYGGIVPELASRHHLTAIYPTVDMALKKAGVHVKDLCGVAVTQGPGLVGSLVVGLSFAKALACSSHIPFTGVNHISGHLLAIFLEPDPPDFPFIGVIVSGGHTSIYLVKDFLTFELLGKTRDDAAGEAFDKVARVMGLEYPGGPVTGRLAEDGDPDAFRFPRAMLPDTPLDFSFSGLKTSVMQTVRKLEQGKLPVADLCASFQEAVADVIVSKALLAAQIYDVNNLVLCGGVAANRRIRKMLKETAMEEGRRVFLPSPEFCTDNAAMIALSGYHQLRAGVLAGPDADVYSRISL